MRDLAQRVTKLTPEQRRQLQLRLQGDGEATAVSAKRSLYPLSFAQQRLWVLNAIQQEDATYHVPGALHLFGRLDVPAFQYCIEKIVSRHSALRTAFITVEGDTQQRVLDIEEVSVACPIVDLTKLGEEERCDKARAMVAEEIRRPFDLATAPQLRILIIDLGGAEDREYIVVFTMHHIVADGWSAQVLVREFKQLYETRLSGRDAALPALPVQYVDYALWQRNWLKGDFLERQLGWWRAALDGASFTLDLPTDRVRPPTQDNSGETIAFKIPAPLSERLRELARANDATLYMVMLAAYFLLLSRWSGQTDICVGTPVANRRRVEHEGLIGFFVNTLVLRGNLSGDPTFLGFLSRVRAFCLHAQEHQDLPFERLVEALAPTRDLSRTPLFQTMFGVQTAPDSGLSLPGLKIERYKAEHRTAKFDLSFEILEGPESCLEGEAEFATALFDATSVERMVAHYLQLLDSIVSSPSARVGELAMLAPAERAQLVDGFNATSVAHWDVAIVDLFASRVRCSPDALAVCGNDMALSYRDLDRQSNQLARELIARGAAPEALIGICLERSVDMIVALFGVLKSGAAYLPLDPDYPEARLAYITQDAAPLLTISSASKSARSLASSVLCLNDPLVQNAIRAQSDAPLDRKISPQNVCYVIYTSGSTGAPKGVVITHGSLANLVQSQIVNYGIGAGDRVLQLASLNFDLSVEEIFTALCSGSTLVLSTSRFADSWSAFHALIADNAITFVSAPTAVWRHYTRWLTDMGMTAPASLSQLSTGTEAADAATLSLWRKCAPHAGWTNAYGPTETTVTATTWRANNDATVLDDVPIGVPLDNIRAYLLDARLEPVPVGVVGELYIGGAGIARGYLDRPELTAEAFIPDPYDLKGARLYRTGDRGRRRPDGQILFIGRADEQVKIRGYRIEPAEVEKALIQIPTIRAAAVVPRDNAHGDKRLVAFVETNEAGAFDAEKVQVELRRNLPEYMAPTSIIEVGALPLTANGKLDRASLPHEALELDRTDYVAPRNGVEEAICRVWAEVLDRPRFGATENFFEVGGHSLLALKAVDTMRRAGLSAEARMIFSAPTPEQFARALGVATSCVAPPNRIPRDCVAITPDMITLVALTQNEIDRLAASTPGGARNIEDIYPLAPLQEGILFHHLMASDGDPYVSPMQFAFASRDLLDSFVSALRALVARHDVLRTAIAYEELAEPVQIVWREASVEVNELPPMTARQLRDHCHDSQFDIRVAPLVRLSVSREPEGGRWLLLMLVHHLVLDHATAERLLFLVRKALAGGEITSPTTPYRDFVFRSRSSMRSDEQEVFFSTMLADVDEPCIPLGLKNVRGNGADNVAVVLPLGESLSDRLRTVARKLRVSAASIFHVAFAQLLARLSGRDDIVFGTVMFGRMDGATTDGLGMYINTLPVRLKLKHLDARAAVLRMQRELTSLVEHEHASLALAQCCSGVQQPTPLFTALLNYRHSAHEGEPQDGSFTLVDGIDLIFAEERSNYPFDLSIDDFGDLFSIEMQSPPEIDPHQRCRQMRMVVEGLIEALEQAPDRCVLDIDILSEDEHENLLHGYERRQAEYSTLASVVDLFNAQVARSPNALALSCGGERLDYSELDRRANRLARVLIARGAGPDHLIGLCIERSVETMVSLLAILKSGAGYLPLDAHQPTARLALMIEEARPCLIITDLGTLSRLPTTAAPLLVIDHAATVDLVSSQLDGHVDSDVSPQNIAYVIYTSGSTGAPKGVAISHANLANLTRGQMDFFGIGASDRLLQLASLSFDMSVEEIFPALCSGATLVLAPARFSESWAAFHSHLEDNAVTFINPSTAVWRQYTLWLAEAGEQPPIHLRVLSTGGEAVDRPTLQLWRSLAPHIDFTNGYGPTETTVNATAWRFDEVAETHTEVPIGLPIANARVYLLDRRLEPSPIGVEGEIFVGGEGVARGYVGRPDLTAERFVPDPHGPPGARLYRTGDLARRRTDGALVFVGRADDQLKIRGFRIEPGEIESALIDLAGVQAAIVTGDDSAGDKRLVAFIATNNPHAFDTDAAKASLRDALPDYMVPTVIVALPRFPLNSSGKIDRKALAGIGMPVEHTEFSPPATDTERALCEAWSEILGVDRVSALDNFFEIGGHSLAVMRMATQVSRVRGVTIPLALIYQTETLRQLASVIDAAVALRSPTQQAIVDEEFEELEL